MTAEYQNFTIAGSSTIEDNGILTNCPDDSSYLEATIPDLSSYNNVKFYYKVKINSIPSSTKGIFNIPSDGNHQTPNTNTMAWLSGTGLNIMVARYDNNNTGSGRLNMTVAANDIIEFIVDVDKGQTAVFYMKKNNGAYEKILPQSDMNMACNFPNATKLFLGNCGLNRQMEQYMDIYLPEFKIYADGNLIYQPYSSDFKLINRVYNRHDTASNFSTNNPVLGDGEVAVETDTSKIKIGDGTTAYNSLPYAGGSSASYTAGEGIDITNNVISIDEDTLDGKQDKLTPITPLSVLSYTKTSVHGVTIASNTISTTADKYLTFSSDTAGSTTTGGFEIACPDAATAQQVLAGNYPAYIDIPFAYGKTIRFDADRPVNGAEWNIVLGKYELNTFKPLIFFNYANNGWIQMACIDSTSGTVSGTDVFYNVTYYKGTVGSEPSSSSNVPHLLITESGTSRVLNLTQPRNAVIQFVNSVISDSTAVHILDEVQAVRVIPKTSAIATSSYGIYSNVSSTNLDASTWGDNEFDFAASTTINALQLSIGAGLAVQNSNLVNTTDLSNYYTKSEAVASTTVRNIVSLTQTDYDNLQTVDANTFYVIIPASNS